MAEEEDEVMGVTDYPHPPRSVFPRLMELLPPLVEMGRIGRESRDSCWTILYRVLYYILLSQNHKMHLVGWTVFQNHPFYQKMNG